MDRVDIWQSDGAIPRVDRGISQAGGLCFKSRYSEEVASGTY